MTQPIRLNLTIDPSALTSDEARVIGALIARGHRDLYTILNDHLATAAKLLDRNSMLQVRAEMKRHEIFCAEWNFAATVKNVAIGELEAIWRERADSISVLLYADSKADEAMDETSAEGDEWKNS